MNYEYHAIEYIKNLPKSKTDNIDIVFLLKNAYITGCHKGEKTLLSNLNNESKFSAIIDIICDYYYVHKLMVLSKTRKQEIVRVRYICMYFGYKYKFGSLSWIGKQLSRSHSDVIHAKKEISKLLNSDDIYFKNDINTIKYKIEQSLI